MLPGFSDELLKIAARAGLKHIRKLVELNTPDALEQANRIARSGALTTGRASQEGAKTFGGSQVKLLGQGAEGLSHVMADPQLGIYARKIHDPRGFSKKKMLGRKVQFDKGLRPEEHLDDQIPARILKSERSPHGANVFKSEYAPPPRPSPPPKIDPETGKPIKNVMQEMRENPDELARWADASLKERDPARWMQLRRQGAWDENRRMFRDPEIPAEFARQMHPKMQQKLWDEMLGEGMHSQISRAYQKRHGVTLGDVRAPNMQRNRLVDYQVYRPGEYHGQGGLFRNIQQLDVPKTRKLVRHKDELVRAGRLKETGVNPTTGEKMYEANPPSREMYWKLMRGNKPKRPQSIRETVAKGEPELPSRAA